MRADELLVLPWYAEAAQLGDGRHYTGAVLANIPDGTPRLVCHVGDGEPGATVGPLAESLAALPSLIRALLMLLELPDAFLFGKSDREDAALEAARVAISKLPGGRRLWLLARDHRPRLTAEPEETREDDGEADFDLGEPVGLREDD